MFTDPNDPVNIVRNYLPKTSFSITDSAPKRHFFLYV